ncbi:hypothetical protein KFL_001520270 [Klebsormidium nitens]|uniref:Uncharacterized protein n=1 Tax=Klebsormidium nitens TaxID=105231 RepID=A0A1Y1I480_KLENI|nr:hypothetical protein KFL_001520270 [Klebsormidium nitens]|eukprot:GAQ83557.1 hypothetical protein KFL_001520270 [Klebsormidium nitens]
MPLWQEHKFWSSLLQERFFEVKSRNVSESSTLPQDIGDRRRNGQTSHRYSDLLLREDSQAESFWDEELTKIQEQKLQVVDSLRNSEVAGLLHDAAAFLGVPPEALASSCMKRSFLSKRAIFGLAILLAIVATPMLKLPEADPSPLSFLGSLFHFLGDFDPKAAENSSSASGNTGNSLKPE